MIVKHLFALMLLAVPALADPAPPSNSSEMQILDFGLYCQPPVTDRIVEPGVALGYINVIAPPVYTYRQQQVPATLGVSFGLTVETTEPLENVELRTYRPDREGFDSFTRSYASARQISRGFTFELPEELVTGSWRLEAHHQGKILYSVEFEVLLPSQLPGLDGYCMVIS